MENVRSVAPTFVKRLIWNRKHARAQTDPLASPLVDFLGPRIHENANLLDLGCAAGNLLAGLRRAGWRGHYTGVDVSPRAISVARQMNDSQSEWIVSAIEDFEIDRNFDIICFVETLYYVRLALVQDVLRSCRAHSNVIYVRIWNIKDHARHIETLGPCDKPRPDVFVLTGSKVIG